MEPRKNKTFVINLVEGGQQHTHQGIIEHDRIAGKEEGTRVKTNTGTTFLVFRPRVGDRMLKVRRHTQIVYPKDAGWLILALDVFPGARIIEMGMGSGAFTILLAQLVGSEGKVFSFDRREDFLENAIKNISRYGYEDRVRACMLNAGDPFPVNEADAVFLDLPNPWAAIPQAFQALSPGRPLALIVPNAEQLKEAVNCLQKTGFACLETAELLERNMLVRQKEGVRPSERMTGFTGYLVSARKADRDGEMTAVEKHRSAE